MFASKSCFLGQFDHSTEGLLWSPPIQRASGLVLIPNLIGLIETPLWKRQRYVWVCTRVGLSSHIWAFKQSIDSIEDGKRNTPLPSVRSTLSRPHTRSQTGIVLKRRTPDDAHFYAAPRKQATTGRKKQQKPLNVEQVDAQTKISSLSSKSRHPSLGSISRDRSNAPQITFWHPSPASDDQHEQEPRLPRARAALPMPIPNLTKKSRGRRVPTQESTRIPTDQKETRLYICQVEGCGKCFQRGEHLKRHIRSIHTHEKREHTHDDIML